ncbi:MAG TPA: hypothetical protein VF611_13525 [Pyrinomonadaceae bacterium]|jgi:hypothetical protein
MRVVIFGLAKSGTTALFYHVKRALPADAVCLFEPRAFDPRAVRPGPLARLIRGRREPDVLAKVLPFRPSAPADAESFASFDRQILLVRDPRDRVVSRLLYVVYHSTFYQHDEPLRAFLGLLRLKEADPRSVPLRELLKTFAALNGDEFSFDAWAAQHARHSVRAPLDFHDCHPALFVCKYEDVIERRLGRLEEYLGLKLTGDADVPAEHGRVVRTKGYGNWRDWLTPEDVEYLRPVLRPYLERYYEGVDWDLSARPSIPAEFGSGYVERIVNERRAADGLPPFGG